MTPTPRAPAETTDHCAPLSWADVPTVDADQAASLQRRWMPMQYNQVDRGAFTGRFRELNVDGIIIVSEQQDRTVLKRQYTPPGSCSVSTIRQISATGRCDLHALETKTVAYLPGEREYETMMPPSDILFFQIDQARVMEAADALGYEIPCGGRQSLFANGLEPSALLPLADTLMASLGSCPADAMDEVDPSYVGRFVMSQVIGAMSGMAVPPARSAWVNQHRIARSAHALIEATEHPLTVIDLCRELKVSRATLQRCFEQFYGIPPLAYLRMHRLNAARRALIAARGTGTTVTSIAMRWGFFHLARFAKDYRDLFGELPSATLGPSSHTARRVR